MSDIYAKFISPTCIFKAPVSNGNISNYHLLPERLKTDGYLKLRPAPANPNDGKQYQLNYRLTENEIEPFWAEIISPELSYAEKRAAEYPPKEEYLDAQVKINSGNPQLAAEGQAQLQDYYEACLAVKDKYPKPEEQTAESMEKA